MLRSFVWPDKYWVRKSMSVIVRTFTPQGFVVAADGRETDVETKLPLTEDAQKIFHVEDTHRCLAYSICETVKLPTDDHTEVAINLIDEAQEAAEKLDGRKTSNMLGYAVRFCRNLYQALERTRKLGRFSRYPDADHRQMTAGERGHTLTRVLFDGYQDGRPCSVSARIFHQNGVLCSPEVLEDPCQPGFHRILGSDVIARSLWDSDLEQLKKYRGKFMYAENISLQDAIERSESYIRACSDEQSLALDEYCYAFGGHIHIAVITPAGFHWHIPPKAKGDSAGN